MARAVEAAPAVADAAAAGHVASETKQATAAGGAGVRVTQITKRWTPKNVNGRRVYQRDDLIDATKVDDRGRSNLNRMRKGLAPLGSDGKPVNLHHLTQTEPGSLAEVQQTFHQQNTSTLHMPGQYSFRNDPVQNNAFETYKRQYWKDRANDFAPQSTP